MRLANIVRVLVLAIALFPLAACSLWGVPTVKRAAFSAKEFGVKPSPRVTWAANPPKGGGRYLVGDPYVVRGKTYVPQADPQGYVASGTASWYGADFHGRRTANGEIFAANALTGASPVLPLPSYVRVTNRDNGRSMIVRVNDRGPYLSGRVMDLSYRAAKILGYADKGVGNISVQYLGRAPLEGDDTGMLLASVEGAPFMETGGSLFAFAMPSFGGNHSGRPSIFDGLMGLFGYADGVAETTPAAAAAAGLAEARSLPFALPPIADAARAHDMAMRLSLLADVSEDMGVDASGHPVTILTLDALKPGATPADVTALGRELGLTGLILY